MRSRDSTSTDEQQQVEHALAGSVAFTAVFHEHYGACLRVARRLVRDEGLAHDVVQDVFLAWWRTGGGGYREERGELGTWLSTLTHHKAVDALRVSERHRRVLAAAVSTLPCTADERLVDDVVWWELGKQSLLAALPTLPPKQREVLGLAYIAGLTQAEIAERLGIPLGTVKSRTHAGMLRLRAAVSGTWTPTDPGSEPPVGPACGGALPPQVRPPRREPAVAPAVNLREDLDACVEALVELAAEEATAAGDAPRTAAMLDRVAVLVDTHGDAAVHGLIVTLARAAAAPPTRAHQVAWGR